MSENSISVLKTEDPIVYKALLKEQERQCMGLEMIASENYVFSCRVGRCREYLYQ